MKRIALIALLLTPLIVAAQSNQKHNVMPAAGYVPDAETAIRIAVAVWEPIYGKEKIASERPYHAELREGVWYVEGSLPEGWSGGVAEAEISKQDAKVLRVTHGK